MESLRRDPPLPLFLYQIMLEIGLSSPQIMTGLKFNNCLAICSKFFSDASTPHKNMKKTQIFFIQPTWIRLTCSNLMLLFNSNIHWSLLCPAFSHSQSYFNRARPILPKHKSITSLSFIKHFSDSALSKSYRAGYLSWQEASFHTISPVPVLVIDPELYVST